MNTNSLSQDSVLPAIENSSFLYAVKPSVLNAADKTFHKCQLHSTRASHKIPTTTALFTLYLKKSKNFKENKLSIKFSEHRFMVFI